MKRPTARRPLRETLALHRAHLDAMCDAAGKPRMEQTQVEARIAARPVRTVIRKPSDPARVLERDFQSEALKYLRRHPKMGVLIRFNSGAAVGQYGQPIYFYRLFLSLLAPVDELGRDTSLRTSGLSDVGGVLIGGRAWFCELKREGEEPKKVQREFLECARLSGAHVGSAASMAELQAFMEAA